LGYIMSDSPIRDQSTVNLIEGFEREAEKVQDVADQLKTDFAKWKHMLEVEKFVRKSLTETAFIEDIFQNWSHVLDGWDGAHFHENSSKANVLHMFQGLQEHSQAELHKHSEWSQHNTRFLFWSCTAVCWFFTFMAWFLLHRLDIVVILSNDYSYRNVAQLPANVVDAGDEYLEEEEEEEEGDEEEADGEEDEED